jgi:hypothetical protein
MEGQSLGKDRVAFTLFSATLDQGPSKGVKVLYLGLILQYEVNPGSEVLGILLTSMSNQLGGQCFNVQRSIVIDCTQMGFMYSENLRRSKAYIAH